MKILSEEIVKLNLKVHTFIIQKSKIKKDTDIYLVDTYGENKIFF